MDPAGAVTGELLGPHAPSALLELSSLDPGRGARAQGEWRAASIARGSRRTRSKKTKVRLGLRQCWSSRLSRPSVCEGIGPERGFARVWVSGFAFPRRLGFGFRPFCRWVSFGFRVSAWWVSPLRPPAQPSAIQSRSPRHCSSADCGASHLYQHAH